MNQDHLRDVCEGTDAAKRYCEGEPPHPDPDQCYADMTKACPNELREGDACYDCFDAASKNDSRLKIDCSEHGKDGLNRFCDMGPPDPKKCM